ncbi:MAG: rhodanese-like domain-containing protein [Gammaproteobacteria bacterium]|nr:rhodanese-like domain-containing protein [Gammaproteobacteria bacterium]
MIRAMSVSLVAASLAFSVNIFAKDENKPVGISADVMNVEVIHDGKKTKIMRVQDNANIINQAFAKTSRPCPPFCIQPAVLAPGVETIAELEVMDYLSKMANGDDTILVIDSRTPDWVEKGTIPGAINIPWTSLNASKADPISIGDIMEEKFNVGGDDDNRDFSKAKTLVMFCNGMWCGQSPNNIKSLLKMGYPAEKIKWYRGGMQDWEVLGLTTVPGKK